MIKYSNGQIFTTKSLDTTKQFKKKKNFSSGNRGMNLENEINASNDFYRRTGKCLVTKRPTPINVVTVDYSHGQTITNAFFEKPSTTDYNGVYKGRYIDFEAKSTQIKTSFPLANISSHQIDHLKQVLKHDGIAFFIIEFSKLNETYLLDAKYVIDHYENSERRSIPYNDFLQYGHKIKQGYLPRLDYLELIENYYFSK